MLSSDGRIKLLTWAFSFYAVCTLFSMAAMSYGALMLALALVFCSGGPALFFKLFCKELEKKESRFYFWISFALTLACAISLIFAHYFPLKYGSFQVEVHFLKDMAKCWYLFWPLPLAMGLRLLPQSSQNRIIQFWLLFFGLLSLLGVFQHFWGWPRPQMIPGHEPFYHVTLFLGHHLSVSSIYIFPFFISLLLIFALRPEDHFGLPRWILVVISLLGFIALFLTYSRMLWIALPVGLLFCILWVVPSKWKWVICGAVFSILMILAQLQPLQKRMQNALGVESRYHLWDANLEFFKARPLTGSGWHHNLELSGYYLQNKLIAEKVFSGHAHNNFLEMLGGTGALGLLTWLLWCSFIFWILWRVRHSTGPIFSKGLICAWTVFHLNGITQVNFWESKVLHQIMWMTAWILVWGAHQNSPVTSKKPRDIQ